jgi:predicted transposase YbfD/YdcC
MDEPQYSTLMDALTDVPDPRKARGKQYSWTLLLSLVCSALASGERSGHGIATWVTEHATALLKRLRPERGRLPSEATLRRALRQLDVAALEQRLALYTQSLWAAAAPHECAISPHGEILQGQALDGKALRGACKHGQPTHLVSLVQHGSAITLAQVAVEQKSNEITAAPVLLKGRSGPGTVTTLDALLTQRSLAEQIVAEGGYYLMVVKRNQRRLYEDLALFFELPAIPADQEQLDRFQTVSKGHGRLETRTLECSTAGVDYLVWPGIGQILRRTCERLVIKTGKRSIEVSYALTNLGPEEARAAELEGLWRGHWTIENRKHYVRDVTLGEDQGQAYRGNTAQVLAALRNGLIDLMRAHGWSNLADALRHYGASVRRVLALIGALPARL